MTLAIRRCLRVGRNAGKAIEDLGVEADLYAPPASAEDLLSGFPAVIGLACKLLSGPIDFSLEIRNITFGEKTVDVELQTVVLDWLEFQLDTGGFLSCAAGGAAVVLGAGSGPHFPSRHPYGRGFLPYRGARGTTRARAVTRTVSRPTAQAGSA
jgi:hypothetical protein